MFDAIPANLPDRRRGPKPVFDAKKMFELAAFLQDERATMEDAARHFNCSLSLIEKTFRRMKRATQEKAPDSDKSGG